MRYLVHCNYRIGAGDDRGHIDLTFRTVFLIGDPRPIIEKQEDIDTHEVWNWGCAAERDCLLGFAEAMMKHGPFP